MSLPQIPLPRLLLALLLGLALAGCNDDPVVLVEGPTATVPRQATASSDMTATPEATPRDASATPEDAELRGHPQDVAEISQRLGAAQALWNEAKPRYYRIVVDSVGSWSPPTTITTTVEDQRTTVACRSDYPEGCDSILESDQRFTVQGLFDYIANQLPRELRPYPDRGPDSGSTDLCMSAEFEMGRYGYPTRIYLHCEGTLDDEILLEVVEFEALEP
ncbi:MAG: hypothetical protein KDD73_01260 [Anaerolineales bacterium]|nr:hypothetical protein [Anaerolineales bacterium]MCB9126634.1 hypothetical protein [Ardenticatenales bacterium]